MKSISKCLLIFVTLLVVSNAQSHDKRGLENSMAGNFKYGLEIFKLLMKSGKDFFEMAKWFTTANSTLPIALDHILDFAFPKNISKLCESHVRFAVKTILKKLKENNDPVNEWSMQLFDSLPKPNSGVLEGNIFWLGNFWECIGVSSGSLEDNYFDSVQGNNISSTGTYFRGEYCIVSLKVNLPAEMKLGLCLPDSCTYEDKSQLVAHWIRNTHAKSRLDKTFCQTTKSQNTCMDTTAMVITGCLIGIILLVLVGTILDCTNQKSPAEKYFVTLSITRNLHKIFDLQTINHEIQVLHGIRCFTLAWIVLGHCYVGVLEAPFDNLMALKRTVENSIWFGLISNMTLSVDTFFMMSSMLLTYTFLRKVQTSDSCHFHIMYLSRYMRITPAFMATVAILAGPFYYLSGGPVWPRVHQIKSTCRESWYWFPTYVFTFLPSIPNCNAPGWYLGVDMQMSIVTPLILYPLYKKPKWGLVGIIVCFALTVVCQMLVIFYKDIEFVATSEYNEIKAHNFHKYYYVTPWGHFAQYLIGMILGYILHVHFNRKEIVIRPMAVVIGWIMSFTIMISVVFGTYPITNGELKATPIFNMLYGSLSRQAWTISVAWMIFASATGNGGVVDSILSWKYLKPISRISYSSYLIHVIVLTAYFASLSQATYFDHYRMAYIYFSSMIVTLFIGLLFCVLFEMPIVSLLHVLIFGEIIKKAKVEHGDRELLLRKEDSRT